MLVGVAPFSAARRGRDAAYGALVGTPVVVASSASARSWCARAAGPMPGAALLVALMTYTLQRRGARGAVPGLSGYRPADDELDPRWLAATIIGGTFVWMLAHIVLTVRLRLPVYDLPEHRDHVQSDRRAAS